MSQRWVGGYELLLYLARGGMGSVHLARQRGALGFERIVVVKRIHSSLAADPDFRSMLIDEARLTSLIRHPNVVSALDVVEDEGELALVLDYVESVSLAELRDATRAKAHPMPPAVACRIMADALAGLHAAHEARDLKGVPLGIIHRDVSPQNILVGIDGLARLIDFGVAKAAEKATVTRTGVLKGKLRYMSPEQARHKPLDRRSDVFAAGVVLYEALCGHRPFDGETEASVLLDLLVGEFPPPAAPDGSALPAAIVAALERALAVDASERFGSAAEFQRELERGAPMAAAEEVSAFVGLCAGETLAARRSGMVAALASSQGAESRDPKGASTSAVTTLDEILSPPEEAAKRNERPPLEGRSQSRFAAVIAVGAVLLAAIALVVLFVRGDRTRAEEPARREASAEPPASGRVDAAIDPPLKAAPSAPAPAATTIGRVHVDHEPRKVWKASPVSSGSRVLHGNPYGP